MFIFSVFLCFLGIVFGGKDKRNGWKLEEGHLSGYEKINLVKIGLRQKNLDILEKIFWDVSNPDSENYTKFLTVNQLTQLIAPEKSIVDSVVEWIEQNVQNPSWRLSINGDYILIDRLTVNDAQNLFKIQMKRFSHPFKKGHVIFRSENPPQIPSSLQKYIHIIDGISNFLPVRNIRKNVRDEPGVNITPLVIKSLYNISVTASGKTSSAQAVAEFEQAYFYPSDIPIFEQKYGLPNQTLARLIGPNDPDTGYLGEASLDVEYMIGVGTLIPSWVFSIENNEGLDLITWALNVTGTPNSPTVHSISWGSGESAWETDLMVRDNTEFQKLAVLGYTVFVASGDEGTGNTGIWCGTFDPTFPASSPYVTSVGGTYLDPTSGTEIGVTFSGGGFSTLFPRPSYQDDAVNSFFAKGNLPDSSYYNSSGRGFPDVSAVATNFQTVIQGFWGPISGTSAASPTFSAIIALVNDARLLAGKNVLGFLNPVLYKLKNGVGTDITQGENVSGECPKGFSAVEGWDAITGIGTPNFPVLVSQLLKV